MHRMKLPLIILAIGLIALSACTTTQEQPTTTTDWTELTLTDITTQENISVSEFEGEPVLVETFAVWCPTCKRQQEEVQQLETAHITINIDPNENEQLVQDYMQEHGFEGHYAIAPQEYTQELINEFGVSIANAPSSPIILVCADQSAQLLPRGLKTAQELRGYITDMCPA